jgi:hypothetical protein
VLAVIACMLIALFKVIEAVAHRNSSLGTHTDA